MIEKSDQPRLRGECLGFTELTSLAIALISPTMTAALIVPLMFSTAGNASWLAYLFGTVMLLFVAFNLNQFARRSTSAGSMYAYTVMGLGTMAGGLSGWCLIWAYLFIGTAGMTGFTIFANTLLAMIGFQVPNIVLFALCAATCWFLAYKDIQLSSVLMLVLEGASVALIIYLGVIVLYHHGFAVDRGQIALTGSSFSGVSLGVVTAIFSLVGFECATAFGEEAREPLTTIPRAVIVSLILTGLFFVFIAYVEVLGFGGSKTTLDKADAPLNMLADMMSMGYLKGPISAGAMISFFSLALSCMNSGARILYSMGRLGVFHSAIGYAHETNETPHVAVTVMGLLIFLVPTVMLLGFQMQVLDVFNDAGTFGAFGFLGAYFLISAAAPVYLKKQGILRARDTALGVASMVLLLVPAVGSVYPMPSWPVNVFPYIFLGYLAIGMTWFVILRRRSPEITESITRRVYVDHGASEAGAADRVAIKRRSSLPAA
ncbi:MAG: APC family permease [Candidatus Binataceae bacterium]|nr:APC family permease [Candidatus Binataceae bacterium]